MKGTSQKNRNIMSIIAIVVGILMITVIPFLVQISLERVLVGLTKHINAGNPTFSSGIPLFDGWIYCNLYAHNHIYVYSFRPVCH